MAGRAQKLVARTDVTKIDYDEFVKECQRLPRHPLGPTLGDLRGRDRKITIKGTGSKQGIDAEVVLDRHFIEVSTKIHAQVVELAGEVNRGMLEEIMHDPTGPVGQDELVMTDRNMNLDIFAMCVGDRPPYIVTRATSVAGLRRIFYWLYNVPTDFEVPRSTRKRARHAA